MPYSHPDFAPLRIMSRILSLKFLHTEIREKGGAYGGGVAPTSSGIISFYSYRDPNSTLTLDTFERSSDWLRETALSDQDLNEAKLGVFQRIDEPVVPGSRGMREFLSDVTDEQFNRHREQLKAVRAEDIVRVAQKYLQQGVKGTTVIGPRPKKELEEQFEIKTIVG